jgi:adenylylsulfate kinase
MRDEKGIYQKAQAGIIKEFTGISAPYEPPKSPNLTIQSHKEDAEAAAKRVIYLIEKSQII